MDRAWWDVYGAEARAGFPGERVTLTDVQGARRVRTRYSRLPGQNSGAGAIALAALWGAERVVLLGYDCQHDGGRTHWHGDHPPGTAGNADAKTVALWPAQFRELLPHIRGVEVINATRRTALSLFPLAQLEAVL